MSRFVLTSFFLFILALFAGGFLFFQEYNRVFPQLAPGLYAGFIQPAAGGDAFPWMVEVPPGSAEVLVSTGNAALPAQRALITEPSRITRLPLIISGEGMRLRLAGEAPDQGRASGEYFDPISGQRGKWSLERIGIAELSKDAAGDLKAWGVAWSVGNNLALKIDGTRKRNEELKARMSALREEIGKRDGLKGVSADPVVKPALPDDNASRELVSKKGELESLIRNIDATNKVSPAGTLVSMSRESIQREAAWIENALDLTAPEASADFDEKYQRALRVKALQDQIADERGLLRNLLEGPALRREGGVANEEEAFYNGLQ